MFVDTNYSNYKYLVSASDNYIILTNKRNVSADWQNPTQINVIYQYLEPSTLVIEDTMSFSSSRSFTEIDVSTDFFDRSDCHEICLTAFLFIFLIVYCINCITEFIQKGGLFS